MQEHWSVRLLLAKQKQAQYRLEAQQAALVRQVLGASGERRESLISRLLAACSRRVVPARAKSALNEQALR